ncbi:MAG TPA: DUF72 domain-containing protein [Pirellulales bacterium]|nr:DUF72 domain-containing protein [Pirellulales bacterium]
MAEIRVGIAGWTYPPWRGNFYPDTLPQKLELAYASRRFNALEINGTFYSLQRPSSFKSWYDSTPPGFVFSLKGGRFLTHIRRLKDPQEPLANFFASGLLCLREKLGPILWQFPPFMPFIEDRFKEFFDLLPHDTEELARLAQQHTASSDDRVYLEPDAKRPVRHAIEFRHDSFLTDRFVSLVRQHNIALVVADAASKFPTTEDVTADWVYARLHGSREMYISGYAPEEITAWAAKVRTWHAGDEPADVRRVGAPAPKAPNGRDVFVFFDNTDVKQRAPVDARQMMEELGIASDQTIDQVLAELPIQAKAAKTRRAPRKKEES